MNPYSDINDDEWQRVVPLLPELRPRRELRGRPLANTRDVLNGVLWAIYSGGVWSSMPGKYPPYQTCHRRFKVWYESGVLKSMLDELYGIASEELCKTIQIRMRTTAHERARPSLRSVGISGRQRVKQRYDSDRTVV